MYFDPTRFDVDPWRCPYGAFTSRKHGPCRNCLEHDSWTPRPHRPGRIRHIVRRVFQAVTK
jgi:hypothetical protein